MLLIYSPMGKIEEVILENYRSAIKEGDYDQAKMAVELATQLKNKIDTNGFKDYDSLKLPNAMVLGEFFTPLSYIYDSEAGVVELEGSSIILSKSENKLFKVLEENRSFGKNINIVTKNMLSRLVWDKEKVSNNLIRIAIHRLRKKIEVEPNSPQILLSIPGKGYIFLGNRTS